MPVFSTNYNKIRIIVGVDIDNDAQKYNFCTIYFWNQDWDLQEALENFVKANLDECQIIKFHSEQEPKNSYHYQDDLVDKESSFQLKHVHIKYKNKIRQKEFLEIVNCVVNFGKLSLMKLSDDTKNVDEWKSEAVSAFNNLGETNNLSNIVFRVDAQDEEPTGKLSI